MEKIIIEMEKSNLRADTSAPIVEIVGCFPNQNETDEDEIKAASGVNLPPELIIYDIVSRLPAKTVGRFRCVSKHWQTLLSDPQFLKIQFTRNNHQTKVIVCEDLSFHYIDFRNIYNNSSDPVAIHETLSFKPTNPIFAIRGSCNGLLLLYDIMSLELSIVNPITHESRLLPVIPESIRSHSNVGFGFGYCSDDGEYIVVIVSDHTCSSPVYMLKRNLWKRVENSPFGFMFSCGAFVNEAINWLGYHSKMIYAFDLVGERFREVEFPDGSKTEDRFVVDVLGGCLCLVQYREFASDFWVMKDYGVRDSWTKYVAHSSDEAWYPSSDEAWYPRPLFFWNGDESIVAEDEGRLLLFDLKQETSAFIQAIGEGSSDFFYSALWTFVDSLFSPYSSNAVDGPNQVQL